MSSSNVTILIDSRDRSHGLANTTQWVEQYLSQTDPYTCFEGSWIHPNTLLGSKKSPVFGNFTFNGTGISFFGLVERTTLELSGNTTFKAAIDNNSADNQTHSFLSTSDSPVAQRAWYTSPILPSGQHSILLSEFPWQGVYIDYFTITTGPSTPVNGQTVVMDDNDPVVKYTGQWSTFNGVYLAVNKNGSPYNYATPYGNGSHISNTVGDAVQIPFTGSSISVYGFFRWNITGSISLRFSLDDHPFENRTLPLPGTSKPKEGTQVETNHLFYSSPSSLSAGDHILQINVTGVNGDMVFDLDMIVYKASFDSPQSMPTIEVPALRLQEAEPQRNPSKPIKANIGAVVGGVAGLLILLITIWSILSKRRRRRRRKVSESELDPFFIGIPGISSVVPPPSSRSTPETTILRLSWRPDFGAMAIGRGRRKLETSAPHQLPNAARDSRNSQFRQLERYLEELQRKNERLRQEILPPPYYEFMAGPATLNDHMNTPEHT